MEQKQATRIQTSILSKPEKRILAFLAARQPAWVTSDLLTVIGMLGALLFAVGFILSRNNIHWIWLSSFGLVVNWYGDSLDGTLARARHRQRPVYGYYLDHTMDCINEGLMFLGIGLSKLVRLDLAMMAFVLYLFMTINVSLNAHLRSEFRLTYAKLGPTEFRVIVILANTVLILVPAIRSFMLETTLFGNEYGLTALDLFAIAVILILAVIYLVTILMDAKYYASIDPPKDPDRE